jgi:hypothetical protein
MLFSSQLQSVLSSASDLPAGGPSATRQDRRRRTIDADRTEPSRGDQRRTTSLYRTNAIDRPTAQRSSRPAMKVSHTPRRAQLRSRRPPAAAWRPTDPNEAKDGWWKKATTGSGSGKPMAASDVCVRPRCSCFLLASLPPSLSACRFLSSPGVFHCFRLPCACSLSWRR